MKWLLRGSSWLACTWLVACASQPWSVDRACSNWQRLEGQFLLQVTGGQRSQPVLVAAQQRDQALEFVGFNTVGAKLFSGRIAGGEVSAQAATLYRGPDADALVWGLLVNQQGTDDFRCWQSGDYQIMSEAGRIRLWRGNRLMYVSYGPASFELPTQKITIQVQRLH